MIEITETAQTHFRHLLQNQGSDAVGIPILLSLRGLAREHRDDGGDEGKGETGGG